MNKVTLIGRITKDLELKHIGEKNTANVKFNLAVDNYENGQKGADFIPVTVWGKQAENLCKYCGKGSQIAVNGALKIRSYDKDGVKKYVTEVLADGFNGIEFLSTSNNAGGSNSGTNNNQGGFAAAFIASIKPLIFFPPFILFHSLLPLFSLKYFSLHKFIQIIH